jgi:hypothetical protein
VKNIETHELLPATFAVGYGIAPNEIVITPEAGQCVPDAVYEVSIPPLALTDMYDQENCTSILVRFAVAGSTPRRRKIRTHHRSDFPPAPGPQQPTPL